MDENKNWELVIWGADPEKWKKCKIIMLYNGKKSADIINEALDLVIEKYQKQGVDI